MDTRKEELPEKKKTRKKSRHDLEGVHRLEKTIYLLSSILYEERQKTLNLEKKVKFYRELLYSQTDDDNSDTIVFTDEGYLSEKEG